MTNKPAQPVSRSREMNEQSESGEMDRLERVFEPEPTGADQERAKALVTLYKRFIAGYDNFESLHMAVADEFAAVREEERKSRDDDWNQELSGFCDENGTPFVDPPENPQEVGERWIPEIIDTLNSMTKTDLFSPGPCGKHPKACWRSISVCSAHQAVEAGCDCCNSGHCTECESEKPLVDLVSGYMRSHGLECDCIICYEASAALKAREEK